MRSNGILFWGIFIFLLPVTLVYGFMTDFKELVGFPALGLTALMSAFLGFFQRSKVFPYPSVINAEKFIGSGCHIDIIRFAF